MEAGPRSCRSTVPCDNPKRQDRKMTSIVVWCGVDSRAPASLYIGSDSRISWARGSATWDRGRKTFSCRNEPFVFGYWGQVLFPALALPLVQERADLGMYSEMSGEDAHEAIASAVIRQWLSYPSEHRTDVGIVIGSRTGTGVKSDFVLSVLTYSSQKRDWDLKAEPMPTTSSTLKVAGSGADEVRKTLNIWNRSDAANTSRAVFSAFCEAIAGGGDPSSGGPPQLVGLHRQGPGRSFGIVVEDRRYLSGADILPDEYQHLDAVEWFNGLFERVDPARKKRRADAQTHATRWPGATR